MRVDIDEPRSHDKPAHIDGSPGVIGLQPADGNDAAVCNADIGFIPGISTAVNNTAAEEDDVVRRLLGMKRTGGKQQTEHKEKTCHDLSLSG
jgi:hypothetical protein